jgi:hypothetical protein
MMIAAGYERQILAKVVSQEWDSDTSSTPEKWSNDNRALGQCAVTACVVQDYLNGDILNTTATLPDGSTDSHYYNVINDEEVDLTRSQFPEGTTFTPGIEKKKEFDSTRDYVLSNEATNNRYELLRSRVAMRLATM